MAGSDVLMAYLSFYSSVKQAAKQGVTGGGHLVCESEPLLPGPRWQGDDNGEPAGVNGPARRRGLPRKALVLRLLRHEHPPFFRG